ncbi:Rv1733c family protein [Mycobacterium tuberculosis]|uniref:Rv1733c family protein n=1 Tax=Mycobacterium tuberculosis TaxID=1773 RepID=UPI003EBDCDD9
MRSTRSREPNPVTASAFGSTVGVIDSNTTATSAPPRTKITVPARWVVNGIERSGEVNAKPGTKSGDRVGIWVDSAGQLVDEPAPPARAIADAALAALGLWLSVAAVAGALLALTRAILIRVRNASWQHDIDSLFCTQR